MEIVLASEVGKESVLMAEETDMTKDGSVCPYGCGDCLPGVPAAF